MASGTIRTPADMAADATNESCRPPKPGRPRRALIEYRVVSVMVRGSKAAAIARLLELTPSLPECETA